MTTLLNVDKITCAYDRHPVVENFSFSMETGDICCLLGPSGCGKTTVLRAIAGFEDITSGHITLTKPTNSTELSNTTVSSPGFTLPPERRNIGMIFQDYALFPHLNVRDNIAFGLGHLKHDEQEGVCQDMLALVQLTGLEHRFPHELSGGQQQRIALARALAPQPTLLLMDEPFSSLDVELRRSLTPEVREIVKTQNISAIMVTHNQEEAFAFADNIGVVHQGTIQQWDSPFNLYHQPSTRFVAEFIGQGVFLPGYTLDSTRVATELGEISSNRNYSWAIDTPVDVLLRPDDIIHNHHSKIRAQVVNKIFAGTSTLYTLKLPTGSLIKSAFSSHHDYIVGDSVGIEVAADHLIAFQRTDEDETEYELSAF